MEVTEKMILTPHKMSLICNMQIWKSDNHCTSRIVSSFQKKEKYICVIIDKIV